MTRFAIASSLLLLLLGAGCLPVGYGGSVSGFGGASVGKQTNAEAGGEGSFHFYPQGSRGAAITGDVGGSGSSPGLAWRAGLGVGYAYVPRPFEAHWGYELLARGALGNMPGDSHLALRAGTRLALFFRPGQSDTVWHQDESATGLLWYVGPFLTIEPATQSNWTNPWVDCVAGIALYALHYSIGAP